MTTELQLDTGVLGQIQDARLADGTDGSGLGGVPRLLDDAGLAPPGCTRRPTHTSGPSAMGLTGEATSRLATSRLATDGYWMLRARARHGRAGMRADMCADCALCVCLCWLRRSAAAPRG